MYAWIDRSRVIPTKYVDAPATIMFQFKSPRRYGVLDFAHTPNLIMDSIYYADDDRVEIIGDKGVIFINRCTARTVDLPPLMLFKDGRTTAVPVERFEWHDSFVVIATARRSAMTRRKSTSAGADRRIVRGGLRPACRLCRRLDPVHTVIDVITHWTHKPMILWGLTGHVQNGRLVTTADQAGTAALRDPMEALGFKFKYVYDTYDAPYASADKVAAYAQVAYTAARLKHAKIGFMGYRDMSLYGTLADGVSLRRVAGPDIEVFEMLEIVQRMEEVDPAAVAAVVAELRAEWGVRQPGPRCDGWKKDPHVPGRHAEGAARAAMRRSRWWM